MLFFRQCNLIRGGLLALGLAVAFTSSAAARPKPGTRSGGFRLFASAEYRLSVNRVSCRVSSNLNICDAGSSTVPGGLWPKGSADGYVFSSGIAIAGIIDPASAPAGNVWAGDTTGAAFFVEAGDNGSEVLPIYTSGNAGDLASWPAVADVPLGDSTAKFFDLNLQGKQTASQEDTYFLSWDGDPGATGSRTHPLGVVVETRILGWNYPAGNNDIAYLLFTFYNVTSTRAADYAAVRPSLRSYLLQKAGEFRAGNGARFGLVLPDSGYTVKQMYASYIADMDVANFDDNFAGVNVPFSLGYVYESSFDGAEAAGTRGWTFDASIFGSDPFFSAPGFVGAKFLASPKDALGNEVGLTVFNTFSRSGAISDPAEDHQLWRYLSGNFDSVFDGKCNSPNGVFIDHMCYVNIAASEDMRFLQSSGPFDLVPGQAQTIAVALMFAAPVKAAGCPGPSCAVAPAPNAPELTRLSDPARLVNGANPIDSITGFLDWGDSIPDGIVEQSEFTVVPRSLLAKALVAQSVFDGKFLLPNAPKAPPFFLVPGDNQVTVVWSKSPTEDPVTGGDNYFAVASLPTVTDGSGNVVPNPLYDPNFRHFDVEGYRIYRGRTNNPTEMALVAQFDYDTSTFNDFRGLVNPNADCAPELGVYTSPDCTYDNPLPIPGVAYTNSVAYDINGTFLQVAPGNRVLLANGKAQLLPGALDTAGADHFGERKLGSASFALRNTQVPFLYVDRTVRNSLRYFYVVTAFDINSLVSGPSSLESPRAAKAVTPAPPPTNAVAIGNQEAHIVGRGVAMDTVIKTAPTLDPTTGKFSGPFQPADAGLVNFAGEFSLAVLDPSQSGKLQMRLDSLTPGQTDATGCCGAPGTPTPTVFWLTLIGPSDSFKAVVPLQQGGPGFGFQEQNSTSSFFPAVTIQSGISAGFEGGPTSYAYNARIQLTTPPSYLLNGQGNGCRGGDFSDGFVDCEYNGSRWFNGPSPTFNETMTDPNGGNCPVDNVSPFLNPVCVAVDFNNAGQLTGVTTIQRAAEYVQLNRDWRNMAWVTSTVKRAADFNVYWGAGGVIDSVIDYTHNVPVQFSTTAGASWGILNTSASNDAGSQDGRAGVLTATDMICVEPFRSVLDGPTARIPCGSAAPFLLSSTAELGQIAFYQGPTANAQTAPVAANGGFIFYLAGDIFLMELPSLPAAGTVWALRSYSGAISGGNGAGGGNIGPYVFHSALRPFTAVGATSEVSFSLAKSMPATRQNDLSNVHTVPDPYYVQSKFEASTDTKVLKFVGLPQKSIIRIYSSSGVLVRVLQHNTSTYSSTSGSQGSEIDWDLRNRNNQVVASGVYFWHVESGSARKTGRFTVVNFAQ